VYLLFVGFWQRLFGKDTATAIYALRIAQALLSGATVYFAYVMARRLSGETLAGLIAAAVLAISPVFVLEQAQVATETLYVALVSGGLALTLAIVARMRRGESVSAWALAGAGVIFGVATLTRAVFL